MFTADISIRSSNGSNIAACNKTDYVVIQIAGDVYIMWLHFYKPMVQPLCSKLNLQAKSPCLVACQQTYRQRFLQLHSEKTFEKKSKDEDETHIEIHRVIPTCGYLNILKCHFQHHF
ncbi:hypothetical protein M8J75_015185 [Diaphorina citri]|nr:hypothetical protein M8J75_015185 [Diaphorina citri]